MDYVLVWFMGGDLNNAYISEYTGGNPWRGAPPGWSPKIERYDSQPDPRWDGKDLLVFVEWDLPHCFESRADLVERAKAIANNQI